MDPAMDAMTQPTACHVLLSNLIGKPMQNQNQL